MPRKPAQCGTKSGYQRHLRDRNKPCAECTRANREAQRDKRENLRKRKAAEAASKPLTEIIETSIEVPELEAFPTRDGDLRAARIVLWGSIRFAARSDPTRVNVLVRELRELWKDLDGPGSEASNEPGAKGDDFDAVFAEGNNVVGFPATQDRKSAGGGR